MAVENELKQIRLVIPDELDKKYNYALKEMKRGENTLVGNEDQLNTLDDTMYDPDTPNALLLGEQGSGKTATVEQWIYNNSITQMPVIVASLSIEKLGELSDDIMISRMRSLLDDMNTIKKATQEENHTDKFFMAIFIDEVHKLSKYGSYGSDGGSSGAMNALKEGTARGEFPIIAATTDYEYREHIMPDRAFDRRFHKIAMKLPDHDATKSIIRRRLEHFAGSGMFTPELDEKNLELLVYLADSFIKDQVNPAKSLAILSSAVGRCRRLYYQKNIKSEINRSILQKCFDSEGYNIEPLASAEHVKQIIHSRVKGQPLALKYLSDVINSATYIPRNFNRPLMTVFAVGTTGTGKSESAKALAQAFFGSEDNMVVLNGGDFSTPDAVKKAQGIIGDAVAVNKQKLILLDEMEKSHRNVIYSYMRMIDEGVVIDSHGITRSVNNTIIFATSNLGANIFSELAKTLKLDEVENPDELSENYLTSWYQQEASVRKALQDGDVGMNDGLPPEILERFQIFAPYLPLPKKVNAQIARIKLLKFKKLMSKNNITIQLPKPLSNKEWQELLPKSFYDNIDTVSVMIAENIVNNEAKTAGARTINRFIQSSVYTKVSEIIADRKNKGLPLDGAIRLTTNGNALFESKHNGRPDVKAQYISTSTNYGDYGGYDF